MRQDDEERTTRDGVISNRVYTGDLRGGFSVFIFAMSTPNHRIYILGLGSIGTLVAHSLLSGPNPPPVALLVHRADLYHELSTGRKLGLRLGEAGELQEQGGFDTELPGTSSSSEPIYNLIVTVKAPATVSALEPIKHRLGSHSTICFLQNGLGQIENLNEKLFPDSSTRPTYMFGIMRLGVYLKSSTEAILASPNGSISVGLVGSEPSPRSSQHQVLLEALLKSPVLGCEELQWSDLLQMQLSKLASNCIINPLTAILDVRNGRINENADIQPLRRRILEEVSNVFESLPEVQSLPAGRASFSVDSLEAVARDTTEKTAQNSSSMREDIRKGRSTEIEYINGWIVKRGKELGIDCVANSMVTQLVLAKSSEKMHQ